MKATQLLHNVRQSLWLDNITRDLMNICRTHVVSLDQPVPSEAEHNELFTLGDMLSVDREDPARIACRRLDWEAFSQTQPERSRAILESTAAGEPLTSVAKKHRVSRSALQANKVTLAREIKEFMGAGILQESTQSPVWRNNLVAVREKCARKKTATF